MSTLRIRNEANNGWIELLTSVTPPPPDITATFNSDGGTPTYNAQTGPSPLNVANPGTPTKANNSFNGWSPALPTTITSNTTFTAQWIPTVSQIHLLPNDIDFSYISTTGSLTTSFLRFQGVIDTTNYFINGADHYVIAMNTEGGQGVPNANPNCGPIIRNGENLWAFARGVIVFPNGNIYAEEWNGTINPRLVLLSNQSSGTYSPAANPVVHFRLDGRFRTGTLANFMILTIRAGSSTGPVLFYAEIPDFGWDPSLTYRAALGGIAAGFVSPNDTGCVEQIEPRSAPNAILTFNNLTLASVG